MIEKNASFNAELAAGRNAGRESDEEFYARLAVLSRPFGTKDVLFAVGLGIAFMVTCFGIALLLNWATR